MPAYGDFETVGEPVAVTEERSYVATVWKARKTGVDDGRSYALKCYAPRRQTQAAASEDELERDGGLRFAEGIKDLRKACKQGGRCLADIHDLGITPDGVWYITDFYPRTLEKFIALRGRVDSGGLRHIVGSVIVGCLALKQSRGFSHGNLKTRNVFLVGAPRALRKTAIHLGDPYPAGDQQLSDLEAGDRQVIRELLQKTVEAQDLRAIGELIFQLVEGRIIQRDDINYPVRDSDAWKALGKDAVRWLEWCNRLLDPNLSLDQLNLETLAREFRPNAVASRLPLILTVVGIVALMTGAAFLIPRWLPSKLIKTVPTANPITYGQTLAAAILSGGLGSVPGNFAFAQPSAMPHAGTSEQSVTFTPTDTSKNKAVSVAVKVTVNKATPRILTVPTAGAISYGQSLKDSALAGGGGSTPGKFAFTNPAATPQAGTGEQEVEFIPADAADFDSAATSVKVVVNKATPRITTAPTAGEITYGQSLARSTLDGGAASNPFNEAPVAGRFEYVDSAGVPKLGATRVEVRFTPTYATGYDPVTLSVSIQVNAEPTKKRSPIILAAPTASAITYGQTLADSTLAGGDASTPGNFTFTTPSVAPGAGTAKQSVTFTPTDVTNYNRGATNVIVTVNKATPHLSTEPKAGTITYGQTLEQSDLSGGVASTLGTFAWTTPGTKPKVGVSNQSVTFTPADRTDFNPITLNVSVPVNPYPVIITQEPKASAITYGETLEQSALSGGLASTVGTFAFTTPRSQPKAGTALHSVTFTPADSANFSSATTSVSVTVGKVTPRVTTEPTASAISSGQTLGNSRLSGGDATTVGTYAWAVPTMKPVAGVSAQSVTFTPADFTDYNAVTTSVSVTVGKVTLEITAVPTASGITYGQALTNSELSGGAATTPGTFAWTTPGIQPKVGMTSQSLTFTPVDLRNYNAVTTSVNVAVSKATPRITVAPTASVIANGQTLGSSVLSGGAATILGTFVWTTPALQPPVGTNDQSVTFTPQDYTNFTTAAGKVKVTVIPPDSHPPMSRFGMDFVWVRGVHRQGAYVEKTELSQGQFKANGGQTTQTSWRDGNEFPVNLTFNDAVALCNGLNKKQSGGTFALPTRQDFLIYCGAGGDGPENPQTASLTNLLRSLGSNTRFFDPNARSNKLGAVTDGQANAFGLINVLGNAWEWCDNGGAGVPAGLSYVSSGFGPSGRLFADRDPPSPDNDVLGVRLLYLPASASH